MIIFTRILLVCWVLSCIYDFFKVVEPTWYSIPYLLLAWVIESAKWFVVYLIGLGIHTLWIHA